MSATLIQNAAYIPEDDVYIKSSHRHDFVTHVFRDSLELSLDGGLEYMRRVGDLYKLDAGGRYIEYCLTTDDSFETIAEKLLWGSRGKDGTEPMTFRPIKEWAAKPDGVNHMQAILENCLNIAPLHRQVVEYWLSKEEAKARA